MISDTLQLSIGQYSIAGRKLRNDDSYGIVIPTGLELNAKGVAIAIADGMSSSEAAKEASECCVRSFLEDYYSTHESWTVKRSVATVLKATNAWLYAQGQRQDFDERGMVSTFSGIVMKSGLAHIFHAGDSRIYRLRSGSLEQLTTDHRIKVGRGLEHLSRAFGINQNLEIDYRQENLEADDTYFLSTDGIHDTLPASDITRILGGSDDEMGAKAIVDLAFERGSTDNLTCQVIRVINAGTPGAESQKNAASYLPFPKLLSANDKLDGFTIVRPIHESSRSQVYLAMDDATNEVVAIKTPSPNFSDDATYIDGFAREEWVGRLVTSPHTLKIHNAKNKRRFLYHVTEYFDGKTLQQWMLDNPKPELEAVRSIVEQVALGLRAMHRKDVLHLDLKPGNIMINAQGLVKIIDFGSSQAASWQDEAGRKSAMPQGTADYSAPEHLVGAPASNLSDIYSLGAIAYEMLTGKLPYGKSIKSAAEARRLAYISATSLRKDIPDWVDAALENAVEKDPARRAEALSAFTENLRKPNSALGFAEFKPLLERNPVAFWKGVSFLLSLLCLTLAVMLTK
jgi:eukaryotic-like serine/threonine-protein kinase